MTWLPQVTRPGFTNGSRGVLIFRTAIYLGLTSSGGEHKGRFFMNDRNTQLPLSFGAGESWVYRRSIFVRVAGEMVCCSYSLKQLINVGVRSEYIKTSRTSLRV